MKFPIAALNQHIAVLGKTRSGKTNSVKVIIEQVAAAGSRVCIIDPIKADYWGLTSSADGKQPALPFHIIGGKHGHVPLHASAGKAIAEVVATGALRLSIVDMELFGPRESGPFFGDFMDTIFRKMEGVLYLVVDEAHLFAPKEGRGGDESMATYWFKRMASGSGSKGVRLIVSTQRIQDLHNTVLSNCDTVVAHRVTFPDDQKRIADWVASHCTKEQVAEVKRTLPNLQRGEAWLCSGEAGIFERVQLPLCTTYDNSRTPTEGDKQRSVKTAQIDQNQLRSIIGDAVKEAEANDPKLLRAKIAELSKQLDKSAKTVQTDQAAIDRAFQQGVAAELQRLKPTLADLKRARELFADAASIVGKCVGDLIPDPAGEPFHNQSANHVSKPVTKPLEKRPLIAAKPSPTRENRRSEGDLSKGEAAVLSALIQYPDGLRNEQLTVLTGYKRSSRDAYLQRLREKGLTERRGDLHLATAEGRAALPDAEPLPTGLALQQFWFSRLPEGERVILEVLIESYPSSVDREQLSNATNYKRSSRDAYLQRLKAKKLIETSSDGVTASETLF